MNARILKSPTAIFCYIFLFSFSLSAKLQISDDPAFTIDGQPWYLLTMGAVDDENIRIYAYHDNEKSKAFAPEQALIVHVSDRERGLQYFHQEIQKVFPDARPKKIREGDSYKIYQTRVFEKNKGKNMPKMTFITAVFYTKLETITIQYVLKPKCRLCLQLEDEWIRRFENTKINSEETILFLDRRNSIPLHLFIPDASSVYKYSAADEFYPEISKIMNSFYTWAGLAGSTLIFYGTKLVAGMMGFAPPCPKGAPVCCCGPN